MREKIHTKFDSKILPLRTSFHCVISYSKFTNTFTLKFSILSFWVSSMSNGRKNLGRQKIEMEKTINESNMQVLSRSVVVGSSRILESFSLFVVHILLSFYLHLVVKNFSMPPIMIRSQIVIP
jgi:hypothetical protein